MKVMPPVSLAPTKSWPEPLQLYQPKPVIGWLVRKSRSFSRTTSRGSISMGKRALRAEAMLWAHRQSRIQSARRIWPGVRTRAGTS